MIEDLTEENINIRNVSLRNFIEEVKRVFDIEYEVDLKKERNKINEEIAFKGRKEHINKLVENDEILYKNNNIYDGVLIAGQKGYGKSNIL